MIFKIGMCDIFILKESWYKTFYEENLHSNEIIYHESCYTKSFITLFNNSIRILILTTYKNSIIQYSIDRACLLKEHIRWLKVGWTTKLATKQQKDIKMPLSFHSNSYQGIITIKNVLSI